MNINDMSDDEKRSVLNRLYNEENKTTQEIANLTGRTKDSIKHLFKRLNIRKENKTPFVKKETEVKATSAKKTTEIKYKPPKNSSELYMKAEDMPASIKMSEISVHDAIVDRLDIIINKLDILIEKKN